MKRALKLGLEPADMVLLWISIVLWLSIFLVGTLVNSEPYRDRFATFEGGIVETIKTGLVVVITYTLTNVAFLCILAGVLGMLGTKAVLGSNAQASQEADRDTTSPKNSAIIRSFFVYLTVIAGVLILGNDPARTTQLQYVRLAGLMSLAGFVVNYKPAVFGELLQRAGGLLNQPQTQTDNQNGATLLPK